MPNPTSNQVLTEIVSQIDLIRQNVLEWKKQNQIVGLVPTMGALHAGHESLIRTAKEHCDRVVVSVFVNPIQFGPNEDYNRYPRQIENDREICFRNNVDLIFFPTVEEMYPDNQHLTKVIPNEFYQDKLCGKTRIGHFDGVATVVLKLFNIVQPDKAYFGWKDAQQLIILKKMVRDLNVPVEIISCPIVRDDDGLALSSRNAYLPNEARQKALSLSKTLRKIEELYLAGIKSRKEIFDSARECLSSDVELEYLEAYDLATFESLDEFKSGILIAIAARIGGVRLIDNFIIN